jgi:xylose isomerase
LKQSSDYQETRDHALPAADLRHQKKATSPDAMLANLSDFELKFSVGIWFFTPGGGRFHDRFVKAASDPRAHRDGAEMAKLGHRNRGPLPGRDQRGEHRAAAKLGKEAGIRVVGVPFSHFYNTMFEFGSLSNRIPRLRKGQRLQLRLKLVKTSAPTPRSPGRAWTATAPARQALHT